MSTQTHEHVSPLRLVVRVLQDLIRRETFTSYADLAEALKARCATLHVAYDAMLVSAAIDQLERGGQIALVDLHLPRRRQLVERPPEPAPDLPKAEAARLWADLLARVGKTARPMPTASAAPPAPDDAAENRRRNDLQAQATQIGRRARRRPFTEVLDDIFEKGAR